MSSFYAKASLRIQMENTEATVTVHIKQRFEDLVLTFSCFLKKKDTS